MTWSITHPLRKPLPNPDNMSESKLGRAARRRKQRQLGFLLVSANNPPALPVVVKLVRVSPRKLDSHDGLRTAFKSIVDGIADAYGIRDDHASISWCYSFEPGRPAIRIEIEATR